MWEAIRRPQRPICRLPRRAVSAAADAPGSSREALRIRLACGIPDPQGSEMVRVQFKNTRSGFYRNDQHLDLKPGDMVAVEASRATT